MAGSDVPDRPPPEPEATSADVAAGALGAPNPMVGLGPRTLLRGLGGLARGIALRPDVVAGEAVRLGVDTVRILAGRSDVDPAADRRFTHPAWGRYRPYTALAREYLAWRAGLYRVVDRSLDGADHERATFAVALIAEALAPSNTLINPAVLEAAWSSKGRSLLRGAGHFVDDVRHNGGLPALAERNRFTVGVDLAATPGAVVHRSPMFELIQFTPQTPAVQAIPLLMVPSQVNKYYMLDLAPGRSLVEYAVGRGVQYFTISWRNPTPSQESWNLDGYTEAVEEAGDVVARITGADAVNLLGVCAGGIVNAAHLGHRVATGHPAVPAATFVVSGVDSTWPSTFGALSSMTGAGIAVRRSRRRGMLPGRELSRTFALLRPNELIWNLWVASYLLGNDPPSSDVLAWNVDVTNLPAALHADIVRMLLESPLSEAGGATVRGTPVDLAKYDGDTYTMGAFGDHIVPWQTCYRGARLFGGRARFVGATGGHVTGLVNPPGNPRSRYLAGPDEPLPEDPEAWRDSASTHADTWWNDWVSWLVARSGGERRAPRALGSRAHPVLEPAPGRYVHQVDS